ncbi:hypothetical protein [Prevotella jejuni]|jgi:hypothetical protein
MKNEVKSVVTPIRLLKKEKHSISTERKCKDILGYTVPFFLRRAERGVQKRLICVQEHALLEGRRRPS